MLTPGSAGAAGHVELSPYMVAFIAFVSGFMAEDAFYRIQMAGKNLFQFKGENDEEGNENVDSDNSESTETKGMAS